MKCQKLAQLLQKHGCVFEEGGKHTTVYNPANQRLSRIPRHREIKPSLVRAICKQLEISIPTER